MASILCGKTRLATASSVGWVWFFQLIGLQIHQQIHQQSSRLALKLGGCVSTPQAAARYLTRLEQETLVSFVVTPYTM